MRKVGILGSLSAHQPGGSAASTNAVAVAAHAYCGWIGDNMEIWTKGLEDLIHRTEVMSDLLLNMSIKIYTTGIPVFRSLLSRKFSSFL